MIPKTPAFILALIFSLVSVRAIETKGWEQFGVPRFTCLAAEGSLLWLGSNSGLIQLNLETGAWVSYNTANSAMPENHILSLQVAGNGVKVMGTRTGALLYQTGTWTFYDYSNSTLKKGPGQEPVAGAVLTAQGTLWAALKGSPLSVQDVGGGLHYLKAGAWTALPQGTPQLQVAKLITDKVGNVYVIGVMRYGKFGFDTNIQPIHGDSLDILHDQVFSEYGAKGLASAGAGYWTMHQDGFFRKRIRDNKIEQTLRSPAPASNYLSNGQLFGSDSLGNLVLPVGDSLFQQLDSAWVGSKLPDSIAAFSAIEAPPPFPGIPGTTASSKFLAVETGPGGRMFLLTADKVFWRQTGAWHSFAIPQPGFPSQPILGLAAGAKGAVYVGTAEGLYRKDEGGWTRFSKAQGSFPEDRVARVAVDKQDRLWGLTGGGFVVRWEGHQFEHVREEGAPSPSTPARSLLIDRSGSVWIGTDGGLFRFNGTMWSNHASGNKITALAAGTDGTVWIAGSGPEFRMLRWNPVANVFTPVDFPTSKAITHLAVDAEGGVWAAASELYRKPYAAKEFGVAYPTGEPTFHDVQYLFADSKGGVWVAVTLYPPGTNKGSRRELFQWKGGIWKSLSPKNSGLPSEEIGAMAEGPDGTLWFGSREGLGRYEAALDPTAARKAGLPENPGKGIVCRVTAGGLSVDMRSVPGTFSLSLLSVQGRPLGTWNAKGGGRVVLPIKTGSLGKVVLRVTGPGLVGPQFLEVPGPNPNFR